MCVCLGRLLQSASSSSHVVELVVGRRGGEQGLTFRDKERHIETLEMMGTA